MWATPLQQPTSPNSELWMPQQMWHMSMNYTNLCAFNFGPNVKITSQTFILSENSPKYTVKYYNSVININLLYISQETICKRWFCII